MSRSEAVESQIYWGEDIERFLRPLFYEDSAGQKYLIALLTAIDYNGQRYFATASIHAVDKLQITVSSDNPGACEVVCDMALNNFAICEKRADTRPLNKDVLMFFQALRSINDTICDNVLREGMEKYRSHIEEKFPVVSTQLGAICYSALPAPTGHSQLIDEHAEELAVAAAEKARDETTTEAFHIKQMGAALEALRTLIERYEANQPRSLDEAIDTLSTQTTQCAECLQHVPHSQDGRKLRAEFESLNEKAVALSQRFLLLTEEDCKAKKSGASRKQVISASAPAKTATKKPAVPVAEGGAAAPTTVASQMKRAASPERALRAATQAAESAKEARSQETFHKFKAEIASLNAALRKEQAVAEAARREQAVLHAQVVELQQAICDRDATLARQQFHQAGMRHRHGNEIDTLRRENTELRRELEAARTVADAAKAGGRRICHNPYQVEGSAVTAAGLFGGDRANRAATTTNTKQRSSLVAAFLGEP